MSPKSFPRLSALPWLTSDSSADYSVDKGVDPDIVLVGIGFELTQEVIHAAGILRKDFGTSLRVRVVNVVDLMILSGEGEHPHARTYPLSSGRPDTKPQADPCPSALPSGHSRRGRLQLALPPWHARRDQLPRLRRSGVVAFVQPRAQRRQESLYDPRVQGGRLHDDAVHDAGSQRVRPLHPRAGCAPHGYVAGRLNAAQPLSPLEPRLTDPLPLPFPRLFPAPAPPAVTHNYTRLDNIKGDEKRHRVGTVVARANEMIAHYKHQLRLMERHAYETQEGASCLFPLAFELACPDEESLLLSRPQTTPTSARSPPSPSSDCAVTSPFSPLPSLRPLESPLDHQSLKRVAVRCPELKDALPRLAVHRNVSFVPSLKLAALP